MNLPRMLTINCLLALPARLVAVHMYEPASSRCALNSCRWRPPSVTRRFGSDRNDNGFPCRVHWMSGSGMPVAGQCKSNDPPITIDCSSITRDPLMCGGTAKVTNSNESKLNGNVETKYEEIKKKPRKVKLVLDGLWRNVFKSEIKQRQSMQ